MNIEQFSKLKYEEYEKQEFTFEIHDSLLDQAYTSRQVSDLRYFLFIHNEKIHEVEKEVLNNKANIKHEQYINNELQTARNSYKNRNQFIN
jgi:hypothetical protein